MNFWVKNLGCGRSRHGRGMGLAEVLVSVAILSLMGTLIFGTFARTMATRARAEKSANATTNCDKLAAA